MPSFRNPSRPTPPFPSTQYNDYMDLSPSTIALIVLSIITGALIISIMGFFSGNSMPVDGKVRHAANSSYNDGQDD